MDLEESVYMYFCMCVRNWQGETPTTSSTKLTTTISKWKSRKLFSPMERTILYVIEDAQLESA
ncbi:hypothetical protein SLEP1_g43903 [Rubroshorea leprosula]|uniref:Uncharacterized protein n=1 Tax=Rubroshorea leprosula TaxID=152421 RepID=A0AAV5LFD5_9ROSI|nr:hypothetical protein SLEP1_g43903 [Rubroshorea leprosula]